MNAADRGSTRTTDEKGTRDPAQIRALALGAAFLVGVIVGRLFSR